MKKADLEELPVLDTRRLSPAQLKGLSDLFDDVAEAEFERLPGMAHCPARQALDGGLSRILGLPDLGTLRSLLASEPVVSNRRLLDGKPFDRSVRANIGQRSEGGTDLAPDIGPELSRKVVRNG